MGSDKEEPRPRMTLRVYVSTREGVVTEERRTVHVTAEDATLPPLMSHAYPPCRCPRCR